MMMPVPITPIPICSPSTGDGYALSGRATVDAVLARESNHSTAQHRNSNRVMPSQAVRDALAGRIKRLKVTHGALTAAMGLKGRCAVSQRLRGITHWNPTDQAKMEKFLDTLEGL